MFAHWEEGTVGEHDLHTRLRMPSRKEGGPGTGASSRRLDSRVSWLKEEKKRKHDKCGVQGKTHRCKGRV